MEEVVIRVEVPSELRSKFELALAKVVSQLVRRIKFSMLDDILSKSKLTEEQVDKLADELKGNVAKRHGL